jgi:hypothetical protein
MNKSRLKYVVQTLLDEDVKFWFSYFPEEVFGPGFAIHNNCEEYRLYKILDRINSTKEEDEELKHIMISLIGMIRAGYNIVKTKEEKEYILYLENIISNHYQEQLPRKKPRRFKRLLNNQEISNIKNDLETTKTQISSLSRYVSLLSKLPSIKQHRTYTYQDRVKLSNAINDPANKPLRNIIEGIINRYIDKLEIKIEVTGEVYLGDLPNDCLEEIEFYILRFKNRELKDTRK